LEALLVKSTHARAHAVSGREHAAVHLPALQTWEGAQCTPQPPQLEGSLSRLMHMPLQAVSPPVQSHCPELQTKAALQELLQVPQCEGSVAGSMQL
jgi:hypothetical protein